MASTSPTAVDSPMVSDFPYSARRQDSGVQQNGGHDNVSPGSDGVRFCQTLLSIVKHPNAVGVFESMHANLQSVSTLTKQVEELKQQLRKSEDAREVLHSDRQKHYDAWMEEKRTLTEQLHDAQEAHQSSLKKANLLEKEKREWAERIKVLEANLHSAGQEANATRKESKTLGNENKELRAQISRAQKDSETHRDIIDRLIKEKKLHSSQLAEKDEELHRIKQDAASASNLMVPLTQGKQVFQVMEQAWTNAIVVVSEAFMNTEPEMSAKLDSFRQRVKKEDDEELKNLPLPRSNTVIAKQMRVIAILAAFARRVASELFTLVYVSEAEDESEDEGEGKTKGDGKAKGRAHMREMILHYAETRPAGEAALRAHMLNMLPEQQAENCAKIIEVVGSEMMIFVKNLLPDPQQRDFERRLLVVVREIATAWQDICRFPHAVADYFEFYEHPGGWHWNEIIFNDRGAPKIVKHKTNRSKDSVLDELPLVIIPEIDFNENTKWLPATHGILLSPSHAQLAQHEIKSTPVGPRPSRTPSERNRASTQRRQSTAAASNPADANNRPSFLGQLL